MKTSQRTFLSAVLLATLCATNGAQAQMVMNLEDANQVFSKAATKLITNSAGSMYTTDTPASFMAAKRYETSGDLVVQVAIGTTTITSAIGSVSSHFSKVTNIAKKTEVSRSYGTTQYSFNNELIPSYQYYDIVAKSTAGKVTEAYISTQKANDKNQVDLVSQIDGYLKQRGLPTALNTSIINKIRNAQNIKLTAAEAKLSMSALLGFSTSTPASLTSVDTKKITTTFLDSVGSIFKVKTDGGLEKYEYTYSPNIYSSKTAVKSFDVRKLTLTLNTDVFADIAHQRKAAGIVASGADSNMTQAETRELMKDLYENVEVVVYIDAKTYDLRKAEVLPYQISYSENGNTFSIAFQGKLWEMPTGLTSIPVPTKFITPAAVRAMYLKY